ncbi:MAG: hypothetical protein PHX08_16065 [Lachnospiraceae bacterium]|nr:hypothetical protein [Lachnospiraceae bacterium]
MAEIKYVINQAHSLMEEQKEILNSLIDEGDNLIRVDIPEEGLNLDKQIELAHSLMDEMREEDYLVFVSPIPCMLGYICAQIESSQNVLVFGNDKREKKELPNGKIIQTVSQTGWYLFSPIKGMVI